MTDETSPDGMTPDGMTPDGMTPGGPTPSGPDPAGPAPDAGQPLVLRGEAVLLDYPLRLWARQQEHSDGVVREFTLLLSGEASGTTAAPPRELLALAQMFSQRFGRLIDELTAVRQTRLDSGADRMDWRVPLPEGTPELLAQVEQVLARVDAYCDAGELLALARPADIVAFQTWSIAELVRQYDGAEPGRWPGPF